MNTINREQWLAACAAHLRARYADAGYTLPEFRLSVGWPSRNALSSRNRTIGQCWPASTCADGVPQVFISPALSDATRVADVLAHECGHVILPRAGHRSAFKRCVESIGLVGKPTATVGSSQFNDWIRDAVIPDIGDYPHAQIDATSGKRQSTRLIKCQCGECGYTARTTRQWLIAQGAPLCPCNQHPMQVK